METDDPPRKNYGFKEREFKRDNAVGSGLPPMPTAKDLAKLAGPQPASPRPAQTPKREDPNDVFAVLQQNRTVEHKHGLNEVLIKQTRSRRKREFWVLIVGGNLAIIGGVALSGLNVMTVIFGLAGLMIFSLGLSWVMWFVMDDY